MAKSFASASVFEPVFAKLRTQNKDKLKKCPECECVWELQYPNKIILSYADFPAYGLKKEICKKCKTTD